MHNVLCFMQDDEFGASSSSRQRRVHRIEDSIKCASKEGFAPPPKQLLLYLVRWVTRGNNNNNLTDVTLKLRTCSHHYSDHHLQRIPLFFLHFELLLYIIMWYITPHRTKNILKSSLKISARKYLKHFYGPFPVQYWLAAISNIISLLHVRKGI